MENNSVVSTVAAQTSVTSSVIVFNPELMSQVTAFANLMADSRVALPAHFHGKPADCMAIAMQSMRWGMDPFVVAQKTHVISGVLGYEAQLVNAVITSSSAIKGHFHYEYEGDWERCSKTREVVDANSKKTRRVRAWSDSDENGLCARVGAQISGDQEVTWGEWLYLSNVAIRNSPLWVSNPKQQIAYLATKYFARLYCPEVILGVYTRDELEQRAEREINPVPAASRMTIGQMTSTHQRRQPPVAAATKPVDVEEKTVAAVPDNTAENLRQQITAANTTDATTGIRKEIESARAELGDTYFELKNKTVARHHQIIANDRIEDALKSLTPDMPEASTAFDNLEALITRSSKALSAADQERYQIALADMRPEYQ